MIDSIRFDSIRSAKIIILKKAQYTIQIDRSDRSYKHYLRLQAATVDYNDDSSIKRLANNLQFTITITITIILIAIATHEIRDQRDGLLGFLGPTNEVVSIVCYVTILLYGHGHGQQLQLQLTN